jgi:hypothetical protein
MAINKSEGQDTMTLCGRDFPRPETLVIDSLSDCLRIAAEEEERARPGKGRDQQFWLKLKTKAHSIMIAFRNAPVNVLHLALANMKKVGKEPNIRREISPALEMSSLGESLAQTCNAVGYAYRKGGKWQVQFDSNAEGIVMKKCDGLREIEAPNYSAWVESIISGVCSTEEVVGTMSSEVEDEYIGSEDG